jgi:YHS domain-containing protein
MLRAGRALPPEDELAEHVYARYLPPPTASGELVIQGAEEDDGAGLERLDPVCLMDVDPATARWKSEYGGRTYYFCAPSCKKSFDRDPTGYVSV